MTLIIIQTDVCVVQTYTLIKTKECHYKIFCLNACIHCTCRLEIACKSTRT